VNNEESMPPPALPTLPPGDRKWQQLGYFISILGCLASATFAASVGVFDRPSGNTLSTVIISILTGVFALMRGKSTS